MEPIARGQSPPGAEPRLAATLAILRDGPHGLEVLLTVRPVELRFMGGAVVFPGGAVDESDPDERSTALREAAEEVGFPDVGAGRLVPAGRWVTPLGAPIRFDTHFFVVEAPADWAPAPDPREVADCYWSTAAGALTQLASGAIAMAPPTVEMLQRLDEFSSVAQATEGFATSEGIGSARILSMRLSPFVQVVLAPNPGAMTGPGTNTYIFGSGPTYVIDPAVDDEEYLDTVVSLAGEVTDILITHRHPDHVGGAAALGERTGAIVRAFGEEPAGDAPVIPIADGERFISGASALVALHTPGHSSDHLCFYVDGAASLFAGDSILGEGTAVIAPPDGNMRDYMASLERMRALHIDRIYPGHFRPLDGGRAVIEGYISHRLEREQKILATLSGGPRDVASIVARAYDDTPAHLHPVAEYSALAHLEKLEFENKVRSVDDVWEVTDVG
jgi:glyoxylase-like metal-dependent hydrolase (beta-lactamase superfamily II)/8-oxo-dGTP pyrophosphatase MutT (NUDIX family)